MSPVGNRRRVELHLVLQWGDQRLHDILAESLALQNDGADFWQYNRIEHQWTHTGLLKNGVDLVLNGTGTVLIFDKRQRDTADSDRELRHHRMAQHFSGNCRSIRNIKYMTIYSIIHFHTLKVSHNSLKA